MSGAPLGNVSYHVRQLHDVGVLRLVKKTPRRGAIEHYYSVDGGELLAEAAASWRRSRTGSTRSRGARSRRPMPVRRCRHDGPSS
jgi:hypothetical protein